MKFPRLAEKISLKDFWSQTSDIFFNLYQLSTSLVSTWLGNLNLDWGHSSEGEINVDRGHGTRRAEKIQVQLEGPESDLRLYNLEVYWTYSNWMEIAIQFSKRPHLDIFFFSSKRLGREKIEIGYIIRNQILIKKKKKVNGQFWVSECFQDQNFQKFWFLLLILLLTWWPYQFTNCQNLSFSFYILDSQMLRHDPCFSAWTSTIPK